jgi:phage terminase large subunit-like protein
VWCDEEPPLELYSEGKTRVQATNGIIVVTFTPLKGMSDVVNLFLTDSDIEALQKMAA